MIILFQSNRNIKKKIPKYIIPRIFLFCACKWPLFFDIMSDFSFLIAFFLRLNGMSQPMDWNSQEIQNPERENDDENSVRIERRVVGPSAARTLENYIADLISGEHYMC